MESIGILWISRVAQWLSMDARYKSVKYLGAPMDIRLVIHENATFFRVRDEDGAQSHSKGKGEVGEVVNKCIFSVLGRSFHGSVGALGRPEIDLR